MMSSDDRQFVWVFNGEGARFPAAVFRTKEVAFRWIELNRVTGVLTGYPVDVSAYDWAVENGTFTPTAEKHRTVAFIQRFTAGAQPHYHFENGVDCYGDPKSDALGGDIGTDP